LIVAVFLKYLTIEEETSICQQFQGNTWRRNSQVMWSGIPREYAQRWADEEEMQTDHGNGPFNDPGASTTFKSEKVTTTMEQNT